MAKNPDWLVVGEGYADVTLSRMAELGGVKTQTMRMREPTVEDMLVSSEAEGSDASREILTFANLCQHAPADLRKLTMRDYKRLQVAYLSFTD